MSGLSLQPSRRRAANPRYAVRRHLKYRPEKRGTDLASSRSILDRWQEEIVGKHWERIRDNQALFVTWACAKCVSAIDGTLDGVAVRAPTLDIAVRDDRQLCERATCGRSFHLPLHVGEQKSIQSRLTPGTARNPREFAKGHDVGLRESRCGAALAIALRLLGALRGWDRCVVNAPVWVVRNASPQARCTVVGL